ncbi:MAG: endopeptidase La [Parcubacteria group bacterium RIFCSPLOWO2_02_FULL_40_12]|nr:MAG: endopeptidase La [Parcubacteria group bacterium RIFCSPLOWO2_02_FULL_40_12]
MNEFKINNFTVKEELPIIALRDMTLFPTLIVPLAIGRAKTLLALDKAMASDKLAIFVTQKNSSEDITPEDLYSFGTIGKINLVLKSSGGTARVEVEGIKRVRILSFPQAEPYLTAKIEPLDVVITDDIEVKALSRSVLDNFADVSEKGRPLPPGFLNLIKSIKDPEQVLYLIVYHLALSVTEQEKILETLDIKEALKLVNKHLVKELEILETEKKLAKETRKQLGKMQKEVYLREQLKSIEKELGLGGEKSDFEIIRKKIKEAKMPKETETKAMKELDRMERMPSFSPEVSYIRTYLDWLVELPWSTSSDEKIDIKKAVKILESDHFGLEKAKERILEYLAVQKQVGKIKGPILCFIGPPGTGKTSIGQSIAKALGRKFLRISLGGVRDEAEIRGHRRTYVGALPGRIIQGIHNIGTHNPVFMLDEIDKIGYDFRGDPSAALLEALDPEQNFAFSDHYLEVPFDLSNVLFITTANVMDTIPPALRDRLEIIEFPGYTEHEKLHIAKGFLIPKILKEHGVDKVINFSDEVLHQVIRKYTREAGVRDLERQLAKVVRKNVRNLVENNMKAGKISIDLPSLRKFLGSEKYLSQLAEKSDEIGVATGLAWTSVGGEVLGVEVTRMPGKGKLELTGHLGNVMRESAKTALSFSRSFVSKVNYGAGSKEIEALKDFYNYDIHIHVPSGAIPKDGPSAGITIATALISLFTGIKVRKDVAMTGEVTLRGKVLEIGGIKEKVLAAHRVGIKNVILPKDNEKDLDDIPKEIKKELRFIFVEYMKDVLKAAFKFPKAPKEEKIESRNLTTGHYA